MPKEPAAMTAAKAHKVNKLRPHVFDHEAGVDAIEMKDMSGTLNDISTTTGKLDLRALERQTQLQVHQAAWSSFSKVAQNCGNRTWDTQSWSIRTNIGKG